MNFYNHLIFLTGRVKTDLRLIVPISSSIQTFRILHNHNVYSLIWIYNGIGLLLESWKVNGIIMFRLNHSFNFHTLNVT